MNRDLKVGTGSTPSTLISNGLYIGGRRGRRPYRYGRVQGSNACAKADDRFP